MKALIVLTILGAALYLFLGPRNQIEPAPAPKKILTPPAIVTRPEPAGPYQPPAAPMPAAPLMHTVVDHAEPIPEAKAQHVVLIRGAIMDVSGDLATINCDFLAPLPEELSSPAMLQNFSARYVEKLRAEGQLKANQQIFGDPQTVVADGSRQPSTWTPKQKATGTVVLRGVELRGGDFVHILAAPIGTRNGVRAYTARFTVVGNVWMWAENGRAGLEPAAGARR